MKTAPFSMRLAPDLKARLQEMADAEHRSLSNFIESRLWDFVRDYDDRRRAKKSA